mmetsp:Transcript_11913/g.31870  ORF Transcript_11913/g.31870 Transcript_11913/m.31870 type:complete len:239 (-) Transcript_11913:353-1069(-)
MSEGLKAQSLQVVLCLSLQLVGLLHLHGIVGLGLQPLHRAGLRLLHALLRLLHLGAGRQFRLQRRGGLLLRRAGGAESPFQRDDLGPQLLPPLLRGLRLRQEAAPGRLHLLKLLLQAADLGARGLLLGQAVAVLALHLPEVVLGLPPRARRGAGLLSCPAGRPRGPGPGGLVSPHRLPGLPQLLEDTLRVVSGGRVLGHLRLPVCPVPARVRLAQPLGWPSKRLGQGCARVHERLHVL